MIVSIVINEASGQSSIYDNPITPITDQEKVPGSAKLYRQMHRVFYDRNVKSGRMKTVEPSERPDDFRNDI